MAKLTTTSYAILGLLARQPWSAYELTKHLQRSGIRAVWLRTESRIYLEFKNLVAHRLATGRQQTKEGRKRSVYTITAKGREALDQWLQTAEGTFRIESEPLLKLLYADLSDGSLEIQLTRIREQLFDEVRISLATIRSVSEEGFVFEQNASHNATLVQLLTRVLETRYQWLVDTEARLTKLRRQNSPESSTKEAQKIYQDAAESLEVLAQKMES